LRVPLAIGSRVGPYEIAALIGEGGMGQVYRARDTKLHRDVAVKLLPDAFARDGDRIARFQREAHALAALNHPNIAIVHGLEDGDGTHAIVMELVDGPTLADAITAGPIPVPETLLIARQLTDALEAAHEQGIVHRDLKPANIKVRPDGTVKVLDFGLAKAISPVLSSDIANSPTFTSPAKTEQGMILGTAAYMAPERARGRPVDKRADIWAFGCVLYEMLAGARPFAGEDVSEALANLLSKDPDWSRLPPTTPSAIRKLLARCLTKDPRQGLRDIGDARLEIDAAGAPETTAPMKPASWWPPDRRMILAGALAGLAVLAGSQLVSWWRGPATRNTSAPIRLTIDPPPGTRFDISSFAAPKLTPDGRSIVFAARGVDGSRLYVRTRPPRLLCAAASRHGGCPSVYEPLSRREVGRVWDVGLRGEAGQSGRRGARRAHRTLSRLV
jgi:serine/threonine protein kinase